jgi:transposase InsO family protein
LVVPAGLAEGGGDVGVAVLAVDADGEVAQAGHDPGQVPGADLRGVLAEGAVADVMELATALFEYLEIFHNRQRRHSALGMLTPIEYELRPAHEA